MTFPTVRYEMERETPAVAAGADASTIVGVASAPCTVTSVEYHPTAAITGADTNTRSLTLYNRGAAGTGTVVVATLALANTVNAADNASKAITLTATAADRVLAAGDVLEWVSLHAASGLADPGGLVRVKTSRTVS